MDVIQADYHVVRGLFKPQKVRDTKLSLRLSTNGISVFFEVERKEITKGNRNKRTLMCFCEAKLHLVVWDCVCVVYPEQLLPVGLNTCDKWLMLKVQSSQLDWVSVHTQRIGTYGDVRHHL